ncbi:MAG TPA: outer membrane beta-barrel protein [Puia sp.]|jgi:hypothetical protein
MKNIIVAAFFLACASTAVAQRSVPIFLNVYGGYTFQDRVDLGYYSGYNNYGYIKANGQYGAGIECFIAPSRSIELNYQYMGTTAPFYDFQGQTNSQSDAAHLHYILIGGNNYLMTGSNAQPYFGAGIGVGIADFTDYGQHSTSLTKFAWNLRLGVKIKTQSAISVKLQAYLQSIVQGVGVGVGFGTGGAGAGVTTYSTMLQFGLGGVLSFDLKHKK